jgi:hypothetical protein
MPPASSSSLHFTHNVYVNSVQAGDQAPAGDGLSVFNVDVLRALYDVSGLLPENERDPPSIVVVGMQSAGKSSLLTALTGVQLPKGVGTVTRAPLRITVVSAQDGESPGMELSYTTPAAESVIRQTDAAHLATEIENAQHALYEAWTAHESRADHIIDIDVDRGTWLLKDTISLRVVRREECSQLVLVDMPGE